MFDMKPVISDLDSNEDKIWMMCSVFLSSKIAEN